MTDEHATDLARRFALRAGRMGEHQYLPTSEAAAATWEPHRWVVDAVMAAHESSAYCRILSALGMEEEGDPVAEVERLKVREEALAKEAWTWSKALECEIKRHEARKQELRNIAEAKRFDRDRFDDDASFADWAQSRARHALGA